jgi:hypothetical protein
MPVRPVAEERSNVKYLCLVFGEAKDGAPPRPESATAADEEPDELTELERSGHSIASARLQPAETAATIRVRNGTVFISDGPEFGSTERLSAFHLIDARDLNDAIRIAAKLSSARLGWVEVRPLIACDPG